MGVNHTLDAAERNTFWALSSRRVCFSVKSSLKVQFISSGQSKSMQWSLCGAMPSWKVYMHGHKSTAVSSLGLLQKYTTSFEFLAVGFFSLFRTFYTYLNLGRLGMNCKCFGVFIS